MSKITLCIDNLYFEAIVGILEHERNTPQKVCINAQIKIKYSKKKFIDYSILTNMIENTMKEKKFFTIEEALLYISKKLQSEYKNIKQINLKISKPDILQNVIVGAKIKRKS